MMVSPDIQTNHARDRAFAPWGFQFLLFAAVFLCYFVLHGEHITPDPESAKRFHLMTGDEPHYLMIAHSLVVDGDVNLYNNAENADHRLFWLQSPLDDMDAFHDFWFKEVRTVFRGEVAEQPHEYWAGRLYSLLPPGFPLFLVPFYGIGYLMNGCVRFTTVIGMHLVAALIALMTIHLVWSISRSRVAALLIAACLCFSGPLVFYSSVIYTELPAAALILLSFVILSDLSRRGQGSQCSSLLLLGCCIACLPWLHAKFWLHAILITAATLNLTGRKLLALPWKWLCLAVPVVALIAALGVYYWSLWGSPFPASPHKSSFSPAVGLSSGWPGLWLDRANGLFWYFPLCCLLVPGIIIAAARRQKLVLWMSAVIAIHWLATGLFPYWTAGRCPPMRYWLPVVPLFAAALATVFTALSARWQKAVFSLAGAAGIAIGIQGMRHPDRLFSGRHPALRHISWLHFSDWAPLFDGSWPWQNVCAVVIGLLFTLATGIILAVGISRRIRRTVGAITVVESVNVNGVKENA